MFTFDYEIICTFQKNEQLFIYTKIKSDCTEEEFIQIALDYLHDNEISQLVKFSCCQIGDTKLLPFMAECDGKYYFNPDINKDELTKKWYDFKEDFLLKKNLPKESVESQSENQSMAQPETQPEFQPVPNTSCE